MWYAILIILLVIAIIKCKLYAAINEPAIITDASIIIRIMLPVLLPVAFIEKSRKNSAENRTGQHPPPAVIRDKSYNGNESSEDTAKRQ